MAFPQGVDFRATAGFVTDPANCYGEIVSGVPSNNYPTVTPQGNTVGFVSSATDHRDRSSGIDARLVGESFPAGGSWVYRIDLPAAGSYDIWSAHGDAVYSANGDLNVLDNGTTLYSLPLTSTAAGSFVDITGVVSTAANWPATGGETGGNKKTLTFSSAICEFTTTTRVCHLFITAAGGGGTIFNDTISEAVSLADSYLGAGTFNPSLLETLSLSDSLAVIAQFNPTLAETLSLADSYAGGQVFSVAISEAVTLADQYAATATFNPLISETLSPSDAHAAILHAVATLAEPASPTDDYQAAAAFVATISEMAALGDSYIINQPPGAVAGNLWPWMRRRRRN